MPKADIVIGGFPCQGFSRANRLRSKEDDRNALYRHLLRCITNTRPKIFLAENVRGILSLDGGKIVTEIVDDFRQAGYRTNYYVANAYEYGVPQSRWRVFFVGIRDDLEGLFCPPQPTHSDPEKISDDSILKPWITVENALKDIPEPNTETELLNHIGSAYKVSDRDFTGHRRTIPNRPSPTILARGNGKGGVCALNHPKNHRRITVRESAILQSFPMNFEFVGGLMSMYRQVGNAVPVLLAEAFARSVIELERSL
jgi:DNA (cytosine-5)-methyltransferase 1